MKSRIAQRLAPREGDDMGINCRRPGRAQRGPASAARGEGVPASAGRGVGAQPHLTMDRSICLAAITALGLALAAGIHAAQEPRPEIEVVRITDALHMLGSGTTTGGNTAAFITEEGVVLVDTKLEGYGQDILGHVRRLTDKPVTTIINTHVHFDHSGSNTEFPDTVHFVAHENIRRHMARTDCQPIPTNCDDFQGENAKYLPSTTFSDRLTLFAGGPDQIDLYYFGRGHTDGDTFVVFKAARTMHTGDMFQGKLLPFIDAENGNGGSAHGVRPHADAGPSPASPTSRRSSPGTGRRRSPGATWSTTGTSTPISSARPGRASTPGRSPEEVIASYAKPARFADYNAPVEGTFSVTSIVNYIYDGR